ncbi:MAG: CotH kinase family protein [Eubacterium sp.]|nr:CotH kinase family protein [Eubacterium sp.]
MGKKLLSMILALALVITTMNYVPKGVDAAQSDVQAYDWNSVNYLGCDGTAQDYVNRVKVAVISDQQFQGVVNVQTGFATQPGIYITFTSADFGDVLLNGEAFTSYDVQGAGMCVHIAALGEYNDLVVKNPNGDTKAELYIYKSSGEEQTEVTTEAPTEVPTEAPTQEQPTFGAPKDLEAFNFYANAKGYQVCFTESVGAVSYNVYMDDSAVLATLTKTDEYIPATVFSAYADNALHTLYVEAVDEDGNVSSKASTKVRVTTMTNSNNDPSDISRVYVVTNSDKAIVKPSKTKGSLTVISGDGSIKSVHYGGNIKLRGNSTSLADKPAYNISFNKKQEVIVGAAKGKKWCLLANAYEKTMMRNKLAMDFGRILGGVAAPEEHYTDLYIDGVYKGTFVISEPAENGRAGVEYNEEGDDVLVELEQNDKNESADGVAYYTTSRLGRRFACEDLEDEVKALYESGVTSPGAIANALRQNQTKFSSMVTTLNDFENALVNTSSDAMLDYIDVDSFVSMYIVNELFQTVDFGYSSVKFYITYDANHTPTIHAGPLWDFDLSSGNSADGSCRTYNTFRGQNVNPWFSYLMRNTTFRNKVIAKYEAMQPTIQNIYRDNALGLSKIHQNEQTMHNSRVRNYSTAGWSETVADSAEYTIYNYSYSTVSPYNTYTYDQHIEYLTNWLKNRNEWICGQWGIDYTAYESEYSENPISQDLDITGYQMTSTYNGEEGRMGLRVVFQVEDTVNGATPVETGLVYGLDYDGSITKNDVLVGSDSYYVASFAAPERNKMTKQMGTSKTASYYSLVMNTGQDNVKPTAFTTTYFVRAYAKMSDGSYVYSDVYDYTVYRVANFLYQNTLANNASTHNYLYSKVLAFVDPTYKEVDYDWSQVIVNP